MSMKRLYTINNKYSEIINDTSIITYARSSLIELNTNNLPQGFTY